MSPKMIKISQSLRALLPLLVCITAIADIAPTPGTQPLEPVFQRADLVCSGVVVATSVVNTQELGSTNKPVLRRNMVAAIQVLDSYKGGTPPGEQIRLQYIDERPPTSASATVLQKGQVALWLLQAGSPGYYTFADRYLGVAFFHEPLPSSNGVGIRKLESAVAAVVQRSNRDDSLTALRLLQELPEPSEESVSLLRPLSRSPDPEVALTAIAILLKTKQPDAVEALQQYLDAHNAADAPIAMMSIGTELGQIADPRTTPAIRSLSASRVLSVRLGAMQALRSMRDASNAHILVQRLGDPDSTVQYLAVITLAETFGKDGDYAPSMYLFDQNPAYYVTLWKAWWAERSR
jgi:hypothetical protein